MNKQKIIILTLLLITIISISKTYAIVNGYNLLGKVIYIDPGHGGIDSGTTYKNILEKDLKETNNHYLIAKQNNEILGYIGISYIIDTADIISIVVSKKHTKKGIASLLLNNIFEFCKSNNISKIMLEVRETNIPAQNLYLKHGFEKISERKNYYDGKENAYIMEKKIPII